MISILKHYKLDIPKILISISYFFALYLFIYIFIAHENYIYSFDYGQHYAEFIQIHDLFRQNGFIYTLQKVLFTIQNEDYNLFSALLLSPFSFISTSRLSYLFAIVTLFYLPSYYLFLKIISFFKPNLKTIPYFLITSLFFLSPTLLTPILRNQSSIDGLIPILLILYLYFFQIRQKQLNYRLILPISFLLTLPPLLHRWYLPFSLSFIFLSFIFSFFTFHRQFLKIVFYYFLLLISTSLIFLVISNNLWQRLFLVDYSVIYHHYQLNSNFLFSINTTLSTIGYSVIILFLISLYFLIKRKSTRNTSLFLGTLFIINLCLFLHIQGMNVHHYYLIIIPILLITSLYISTAKLSPLLSLLLFVILLGNFIYPVIQGQDNSQNSKIFFLSSQDSTPWHFSDNSVILKIISDLSVTNFNKIYILSPDLWLNASLFKYYTCYFNQQYISLCPKITDVTYYISTDGFPSAFFQSDYFLFNPDTLNLNSDPAMKNLATFIIQHPQYYQAQKYYLFPKITTITLYHLIKTPSSSDFDQLTQSLLKNYE